MNVLTIISGLSIGGVEKTLLSCLPHLTKEGVEMDILCSAGGELDEAYKKNGAQIIDFGRFKQPFIDTIKLWNVLNKKQYDVVHSRFGHTSGLFALICKIKGIPCLISVHNEKAMFRNNWQGKPILSNLRNAYLNFHKKLTQKYATKILGHSKANLQYFIADYTKNEKYMLLYNGVDFSRLDTTESLNDQKQSILNKFVENSALTIISVGKFKEQKNHSFMIDAFASVQPLENNYKLILIGSGVLKPQIVRKVNELNLTNNVLFTDVEQNITPYLAASDLFFFPSLYEGFGNVIIEAHYKYLPILASGIPPHYESTYKYFHKFFFNPSNLLQCKEMLISILEEIKTPGKLDIVREEAYSFAKEFSIETMSNKMIDLFKKITYS